MSGRRIWLGGHGFW